MVKRILFFCALAVVFAVNSATATRTEENNDKPSDPEVRSIYKRVILFDNTVDCIHLLFRYNYGEVTAVVKDEVGNTVYQETTIATNGSELYISTEDWMLGGYTLAIADASGSVIESWALNLVEE